MHFLHSDWKEECVLETGLCIVFCPVQNFHFVTSSESLVIWFKVRNGLFLAYTCSFWHCSLCKSPKYWVAKWRNLTKTILWKFRFRLWKLFLHLFDQNYATFFDFWIKSHKFSWLTSEINFWSFFDVLLTNINHFEGSTFITCNVFFWGT